MTLRLILPVTVVAICVLALVAFAERGAFAQTPPAATASPVSGPTNTPKNPAPTPDTSRPAPSFTPGPLTINATIRLAVSPDGLSQVIPDGTKIEVITNAGVCVEVALPPNAIQELNATKQLVAPPIVIPEKGVATPRGTPANCPALGELFTIALVYPDGSSTPLLTTIYSGGNVSVELVVSAPGPVSEAPARLPSTGTGGDGLVSVTYAGVVLFMTGALAFAASRVIDGKRR